jgi:hypothetical protein
MTEQQVQDKHFLVWGLTSGLEMLDSNISDDVQRFVRLLPYFR